MRSRRTRDRVSHSNRTTCDDDRSRGQPKESAIPHSFVTKWSANRSSFQVRKNRAPRERRSTNDRAPPCPGSAGPPRTVTPRTAHRDWPPSEERGKQTGAITVARRGGGTMRQIVVGLAALV